MNAKPCKTELAKLCPVELVATVVERGRVESNLADLFTHDLVDPHRLIENAAQMEELNLKGQLLRTPQRLGSIEANIPRLVVRQVLQRLRQDERGFGIRPIGQLARAAIDVDKAERVRSRRRRSEEERDCRKPDGLNHGNNCASKGAAKAESKADA